MSSVYGDIYEHGQYAVVIGVNDYPDGHSLEAPDNDACRMAHYFEEQGAKVICCFEGDETGNPDFTRPRVPTRDDLADLLQPNRYGEMAGARLFFYLSGHAANVNLRRGTSGTETHTYFLMPQPALDAAVDPPPRAPRRRGDASECVNSRPAVASAKRTVAYCPAEQISGHDVTGRDLVGQVLSTPSRPVEDIVDDPKHRCDEKDALESVALDLTTSFEVGLPWPRPPPQHTVVIVDACNLAVQTPNLGYETKGEAKTKWELKDLDENLRTPGATWILATRGGESAVATSSGSVFTNVLLRGLHGEADSDERADRGAITKPELELYLRNRVAETERALHHSEKERVSTPRMLETTFGETLFLYDDEAGAALERIESENGFRARLKRSSEEMVVGYGLSVILGSVALYLQNDYQNERSRYAASAVPTQDQWEHLQASRHWANGATWGAVGLAAVTTGIVVINLTADWDPLRLFRTTTTHEN